MGLFDIFNTDAQQQAAQDQITNLNVGRTQATGDINTGLQQLQGSYAAGLAPLTQNYATQSAGLTQLANLLGFGPSGGPGMQTTLENTPGYQFTRDQGIQGVQRANAAQGYGGGGDSGNVDRALASYTTGLANQTYGNYANQLAPFLGSATTGAGQIAGLNQNLGNAQLATGNVLGNIDYGTAVGTGNALASKDLASLNASANDWSAIMGGAKLAANLFGGL